MIAMLWICVYEPASQVLMRKPEIFLAYIRRCVAALVHRELKNKYIENKIEQGQPNPRHVQKSLQLYKSKAKQWEQSHAKKSNAS